ncbi:MAG: sulfite exporter TauE/SafE family protein [Candidatus Nealsonbacteria bacterium]
MPEKIKEYVYFVKGMHCASCEILIEKKLLELKGVKSVEAKMAKGEVLIEYAGKRPETEFLNSIFKKENYVFFDEPFEAGDDFKGKGIFNSVVIALLLIGGFLYLTKSGLSGLVSVNTKSSLFAFFALGLIAGISSCAALVGGLILSMSKQWLTIYSDQKSTFQKLQPHLMFNIGRILTYAVLGTVLGAVGSKLQISLQFTSFLIVAISVVMLILALQMLGVKSLRRFQPTLPKFATRYIANETNFKGRYMPFVMGGLTFFLPCGFTITAQGLALISGNPIQGGLIMALFALGTVPALLLIGFSSVKFSSRPHLAFQFSRVAALVILFFALFNINSQMNVLGFISLDDIIIKPSQTSGGTVDANGLALIVDGKQVLKMTASSSGYKPNYFKVEVNTPVRWEIADVGTSGCTNAIISNSLFSGSISLTPGQTSIKEFTPTKVGKYKFSCWMGMVSGIIEVTDQNNSVQTSVAPNNLSSGDNIISSGAQGCGCGAK